MMGSDGQKLPHVVPGRKQTETHAHVPVVCVFFQRAAERWIQLRKASSQEASVQEAQGP